MADAEILTFPERLQAVLKYPDEFFPRLSSGNLKEPLWFYFSLSLLSTALSTALAVASIFLFGSSSATLGVAGVGMALTALIVALLGTLMTVVASLVINLLSGLLGGKGDFSLTLKALVYSAVPSFAASVFSGLLGLIPIAGAVLGALVGAAGVLYSLYLGAKGVKIVQGFEMWKAAVLVFFFYTGTYVMTGLVAAFFKWFFATMAGMVAMMVSLAV